jgi:hypothetical protein
VTGLPFVMKMVSITTDYKLFELIDELAVPSDAYKKVKKIADACTVKME